MLIKFGGLAALLLGGLYVGGMFDAGYKRDVGRSQVEVMRALEDLDISAQPGAPGTDPSRSGGVKAMFRLDRTATSMTWTVMSGQQVATRMTADFTPIDATHTRVTAHVERGDAPDDVVSPAFRSPSITMGLFSMALEGELNALTSPPTDVAGCAKLMEDFRDRMTDASLARHQAGEDRPKSLTGAMGDTSRAIMSLNALEGERRRLGCKDGNANDFAGPTSIMKPADPSDHHAATAPSEPGAISFEPGQPMLDPTVP